ncbi:N-acetyltransferase [Saccharolobus solfataricus]|uniref:N-acetyltransferase n=2 Tax=Saccharolobus solfataricus TaxID=2287 RepID=A0A157SY14_SACSO|nr:N-acetyltransferase [Saccharolobus solfataricus]AYN75596.1 N-acetyltransferase [Saccharolobus solfataricus]AYN75759.1 N-acetyltransferase [Saccharolobus solfataricus]AYP18593.1 N-acetyltransferase [Saccharolobus solfataricus]AZF68279.1 N-acetyltransferase [Saccharolobus solfataricus]AZF70899.1 N-acetyltransferase [Saccharolobus solfataricus]
MNKDFRDKGLVYAVLSHSLRVADTRILTVWVDERNVKSQKLLENLGFEGL